jgi:FKBP-type peptidyl-prolyl cis-trans isomerase
MSLSALPGGGFAASCSLLPTKRPGAKIGKADAGIEVVDVVTPVDDAPIPVEGDTVTVEYTVKNKKGKHLYPLYSDTSLSDRKQGEAIKDVARKFTFKVGSGQAIKGLDRAVCQMNEGERFIVKIPPGLAYPEGVPGIVEPDEILIFDLKLLAIDHVDAA